MYLFYLSALIANQSVNPSTLLNQCVLVNFVFLIATKFENIFYTLLKCTSLFLSEASRQICNSPNRSLTDKPILEFFIQVGYYELVGEIIRLEGDYATIQVRKVTTCVFDDSLLRFCLLKNSSFKAKQDIFHLTLSLRVMWPNMGEKQIVSAFNGNDFTKILVQ